MILLSLASKQIWPHILAVTHLKPASIILLHSEDDQESRLPAQKIKTLIETTGLLPKGSASLHCLPHDDFVGVHHELDTLVKSRRMDPNSCILNFTGGNKLMAIGAFIWAESNSVKSCYLERGNTLMWFEPEEGEITTRTEKVQADICNAMDPLPLLRCQIDASEVEREGEKITLSQKGRDLSEGDFKRRIENPGFVREWLNIEGTADSDSKKGDQLELNTAAVLLKLGVSQVRRSLRLKVKSAHGIPTGKPHAEFDLLFNWSGRLWLVDCKDRVAPAKLVHNLVGQLRKPIPPEARNLLSRIEKELSIGQTKALKEDLLSIREMGGLLGQVVCVRKDNLGEEVSQFARNQRIEVIQKKNLYSGFEALLFPNRPAAQADMADLATMYRP